MPRIQSVLLDRDGTVIMDKHYLADPDGVELLPGAAQGLALLAQARCRLFLVTNQSGIGRGFFTEKDFHACHAAMTGQLRDIGITLEGMAFCPHGPDSNCECRKPNLGMWRSLSKQYGLESATSAMVGDTPADIFFGRAAHFPAVILVLTGKGKTTAGEFSLSLPAPDEPYRAVDAEATPSGVMLPHAVAHDLTGAARYILDMNAA